MYAIVSALSTRWLAEPEWFADADPLSISHVVGFVKDSILSSKGALKRCPNSMQCRWARTRGVQLVGGVQGTGDRVPGRQVQVLSQREAGGGGAGIIEKSAAMPPDMGKMALTVDAAYSSSTGKGECRAVLVPCGREMWRAGPWGDTTNNIMEYIALVKGLRWDRQEGHTHPALLGLCDGHLMDQGRRRRLQDHTQAAEGHHSGLAVGRRGEVAAGAQAREPRAPGPDQEVGHAGVRRDPGRFGQEVSAHKIKFIAHTIQHRVQRRGNQTGEWKRSTLRT